jgi:hypothetical protein
MAIKPGEEPVPLICAKTHDRFAPDRMWEAGAVPVLVPPLHIHMHESFVGDPHGERYIKWGVGFVMPFMIAEGIREPWLLYKLLG